MKYLILFFISSTAFAQTAVIPNNKVALGKTGAADKTIEFNLTKAGASTNPKIKWANSSSKLQYSNDGTTFTDIGMTAGNGTTTCSNASTKCRVEFAYFASGANCSTGTCTKALGTTNLSLVWSATGVYDVTASAGTFSAAFTCVGTHFNGPIITTSTAATSTVFKISTVNTSGVAGNSRDISLVCVGPN